MTEMREINRRRVSAGFALLVFLLPMPLALLTLGRGYSTTARILSIGWLVLAALMAAGYLNR